MKTINFIFQRGITVGKVNPALSVLLLNIWAGLYIPGFLSQVILLLMKTVIEAMFWTWSKSWV